MGVQFMTLDGTTNTNTTSLSVFEPYTAKYFKYGRNGIFVQPLGGHKILKSKDKDGNVTETKVEAPLRFDKLYISVASGNTFLMGGTFTINKIFKLGKCAGFEEVLDIISEFNTNANKIMERMKQDGTYSKEVFEPSDLDGKKK